MSETDALIQEALKAEEAERKLQKQQKHEADKARKAARKGKTLQQIEAEEGGPVKESMVGMAQSKRAAKRKAGRVVDDTDLVEDVEGVEEELEQEEEDGIKLEAFNLKEERARGFFDESGNYVEREDKEEADAQDAWLLSDEAKVVSEEVRRRIEEAQRRAEAAAAADAAPLSATQIARLQYTAAQALQPGETVAAGLKRLGGQGRRPAKRGRRGGDDGGGAADAAPDPAAKEQFQRLTEAAMKLMDAGENDVYSQTKEYFLRAAAVFIDVDDGEGPSNNPLAAGAGKAAYEDADEDMFASDDEKEKEQEQGGKAGASGGGAEAAAAPPPAGGPPGRGAAPAPAPAAAANDTTDYAGWPIKELRRFLDERGVDSTGILDKVELVERVKQAAAAGPEGEAPAGYTFDPATGYFYSTDTGMYWDASSGGFYSSSDGKWYSWDAAKEQFVEWKQQ